MKRILCGSYLKILIVVPLVILASLPGCSGYGASNPTNTSAPASSNSIALVNFAFSPATLTVKIGTAVTWTNKDSTTHTVTSDSGAFESGNLAPDATYTYVFSKAGTFTYHCTPHPYMKGTVVVQ